MKETNLEIKVPSIYSHVDNGCTIKVKTWDDNTAWLVIACECGDLTANLRAPEMLELIGVLSQAYAEMAKAETEED
jgi:hypothetical protein